eukprot:7815978-Pyramimonas_sp.AAC.1
MDRAPVSIDRDPAAALAIHCRARCPSQGPDAGNRGAGTRTPNSQISRGLAPYPWAHPRLVA